MDEPRWIQLLNSDWRDYRGSGLRRDRIDDPAWLAPFIQPWRRELAASAPADIREALKGLRRLLRTIVDRVDARRPVSARARAELNSVLAASPFVRRLDPVRGGYDVAFVPRASGPAAMVGEIAAGFAETLAGGGAGRIKVCDNRDCRWVFYDRSKNRSRRWCEGNTGCGNLMKVRRFRARRKGGH